MNCESIQDTYKIKCSDCETVDEARIESSKTWNPFKEFITIFKKAKDPELINLDKDKKFYLQFYKGDSCINFEIS